MAIHAPGDAGELLARRYRDDAGRVWRVVGYYDQPSVVMATADEGPIMRVHALAASPRFDGFTLIEDPDPPSGLSDP